MSYIQATTEAEFKAVKPKKREHPEEELRLFNWAKRNNTWVSLADNVGAAKLNTIKINLDKSDYKRLAEAAKLAPNMKIILGQGSSATRGKSSADTKVTENLQCIYLAAKYKNVELKDVGKSFSGDLTINQCLTRIEKVASPSSWYYSSSSIAEAIYRKYGGTSKDWTFRKGDTWVQKIYKKYNEFNREAKIFSQGDKWNPADIWMTKGAPEIPDSVTDILKLNVWIESEYDKGNIIPISLKQHIRDDLPKLILKNNQGYDPDDYNFDGYTISKKDYNQSKYTILYFNNSKREEIYFRTVPAFVGEVQGSNYRIGKITYSGSTSPLGRRIKKYLPKKALIDNENVDLTVPDFNEAENNFRAQNKEIQNKMMLDFYNTYKNIVLSPLNDNNIQHAGITNLDTKEEFNRKVNHAAATDGTYKVSKYIGMKIILATLYATEKERNAFISSMVQYAKSESDLSCLHVLNG